MRLSSEIMIYAPAERVWEIVGRRFDRIGEWATAIASSRPSGPGDAESGVPVAGRDCQTGIRIAPRVVETILSYDDAGRRLTYEGAGLPTFVTTARNRWQVIAIDAERAHVRLEATLETRGALGRLLRLPLRVQLNREGRRLLQDLKHYAEHDQISPRKDRQLGKQRHLGPSRGA